MEVKKKRTGRENYGFRKMGPKSRINRMNVNVVKMRFYRWWTEKKERMTAEKRMDEED